MDAALIGLVAFACTFGGALLGMALRRALPDHHLDSDSKDTIKVGVGLVATMTALVLGLVTASAKTSFDAVDSAVKQTAVDVLVLDRTLARYGPETGPIRIALKQAVATRVEMLWPLGADRPTKIDPIHSGAGATAEQLASAIRTLQARDDTQRALQARAVDQAESLLQARWLVLAGTEASIPVAFLVVLTVWLALIFASFGLFAPRNPTVLAVLLVCALSVASAVFLVLEMESPFSGLMRVSADPLRYALGHLNL
jgi:hypothetical protein